MGRKCSILQSYSRRTSEKKSVKQIEVNTVLWRAYHLRTVLCPESQGHPEMPGATPPLRHGLSGTFVFHLRSSQLTFDSSHCHGNQLHPGAPSSDLASASSNLAPRITPVLPRASLPQWWRKTHGHSHMQKRGRVRKLISWDNP